LAGLANFLNNLISHHKPIVPSILQVCLIRFDIIASRHHGAFMRTTLALDNDAYALIKAKADHENVSLGKAASELILQSVRMMPANPNKSGAVFRSLGGRYTSEQVEEAISDE
jgi:hypothetical protein